jgi:hypothetical protein
VQFAALHSDAIGTKRTYRHDLLFVRFWCEADIKPLTEPDFALAMTLITLRRRAGRRARRL